MIVYSRTSRVPVCKDYKSNIIKDSDHPILEWKTRKDRMRPGWFAPEVQREFHRGLPKLSSRYSENALTWNVFRTLQKATQMHLFTDIISSGMDTRGLWFWGRDLDRWSDEIDPDIKEVINRMEPWGRRGVTQQTESDVILRCNHYVIVMECKLGKQQKVLRT